MSYATLGTVNWGTAPVIPITLSYDCQRSGSSMQYRLRLSVSAVSGGSWFGYPIYAAVALDGSSALSGVTLKNASPQQWSSAIVYETPWLTVYGKTAGSTACTVRLYSGSGSARDESYTYSLPVSSYGGSTSGGGSVTMADFSLSFGSITLGQSNPLTFTRPSSGYSCRLSCTFGGSTWSLTEGELSTVTSDATHTVYGWTPDAALAASIPDSLSGSGTLTLAVYSGSTLKGRKEYPFTAYVGENLRPTASLAVTVVNDDMALGGLCVKGLSRLRYTITAAAQGGATIQETRFQFAGQTLSGIGGSTAPIAQSGTLTPAATVRDSRGRSVTVTAEPITVYDYQLPVIRSSFAWRCDANGTENERGAYLRLQCQAACSPLDGRNALTVRARYRAVGGAYGGYVTLASGTVTTVGGGLDPAVTYEVELSAIDSIGGEKTVRYTSSTAAVALHLRSGGNGAAFGKYAERDALECAWDADFSGDVSVAQDMSVGGCLAAQSLSVGGRSLLDMVYPVGAVYLSASAISPSVLFGGTWEAIEDRFLLGCGTRAALSTGGSIQTDATVTVPGHSHDLSITAVPNLSVTLPASTGSATCSHKHSVTIAHTHSMTRSSVGKAGNSGSTYYAFGGSTSSSASSTGAANTTTFTTGDSNNTSHSHSLGSGSVSGTISVSGTADASAECQATLALDTMPPYLAVYMWRRTA